MPCLYSTVKLYPCILTKKSSKTWRGAGQRLFADHHQGLVVCVDMEVVAEHVRVESGDAKDECQGFSFNVGVVRLGGGETFRGESYRFAILQKDAPSPFCDASTSRMVGSLGL